MVWLRDPPGRQPAGNTTINNVTVAGVPGTWNIRYGTVNSRPIVNYVRAEGQDACEFEFNVMDFVNDAQARSATTPRAHAARRHRARRGGRVRVLDRALHERHVGRLLRQADDEVAIG